MDDWYANPVVWTLVGLAILGAFGRILYWRGRVDSDRASFKEFMEGIKDDVAEIRSDIKKILDRLPPPTTVVGASPQRLIELGKKTSTQLEAHTPHSVASAAPPPPAAGRDPARSAGAAPPRAGLAPANPATIPQSKCLPARSPTSSS